MRGRVKISKLMSYILRHNPMGLRMGRDGSVYVGNLLNLMQKKYPWLDGKCLEEIVREDEKGRYELKGSKIRARYGHGVDIAIGLALIDVKTHYDGPSDHLAKEILKEGLKPMKRKKVHLSRTIEDAVEVGKRRTANPLTLKIDAQKPILARIRIVNNLVTNMQTPSPFHLLEISQPGSSQLARGTTSSDDLRPELCYDTDPDCCTCSVCHILQGAA